ncbi:MAG: hypothetical protein ACTHQQ_09645 [Solirubrobacteraceae bacterium]
MPPEIASLHLDISFQLPAHFLDVETQRAGFVLLGSFLISFLFIRTSSRLIRSPRVPWWPGSVTTDSGLHLHHLVWGIFLMLVSGFLAFVTDLGSPGRELLAAAFGVGAGFTMDEFALWIHLRDVYWTEEGRSSFTAVIVLLVLGGLVLLGVAPLDLPKRSASVDTLVVGVAFDVFLAALAVAKGKRLLAMIGIFLPVVSLVGAIRLASPRSLWARRFYKQGGRKRARSEARWARIDARRRRVYDAVVGAPEARPALGPALANEEVARESLRDE